MPRPILRVGMDVGLERRRGAALQIEREVLAVPVPKPMGEAMGLDGVEALEVEHRLDEARAGGIAVEDRDDVGAEGLGEVGGSCGHDVA